MRRRWRRVSGAGPRTDRAPRLPSHTVNYTLTPFMVRRGPLPEHPKHRILLVGDAGARPDGLERFLVRGGFQVTEAAYPPPGPDRPEPQPPDLLILTIAAQEAGLAEAVRDLATAARFAGAPVIVLVADGGGEGRHGEPGALRRTARPHRRRPASAPRSERGPGRPADPRPAVRHLPGSVRRPARRRDLPNPGPPGRACLRPHSLLVRAHGPGRRQGTRGRGVREPGDPRPAGRARALPGDSGSDPHRTARPHSGRPRAPAVRGDSPALDAAT